MGDMGDVNISSKKLSEVFQFSPLYGKETLKGKATSLVFHRREGTPEIWKTDAERDRIFNNIWQTEQFRLKNKDVVEVKGLTPEGEYIYTYRKNDELVCKTISSAVKDCKDLPKPDTNEVTPPLQTTYYKVQQLSLREFKLVQATNAIIAFLYAMIAIILTPFSYIYQLIAGRGEPRAFASMLAPVEHDRVGEIDHNAVLSQLNFMARLCAQEDPANHGQNLGLEPSSERTMYFGNRHCSFKKTDTHYEIVVGTPTRIENKQKGTKDFSYKDGKEVDNREEIWLEGSPSVVLFKNDDPLLTTDFASDKDYPKRKSRFGTAITFQPGTRVKLPKNHPCFEYTYIVENPANPSVEEMNPTILSATQQMSHRLSEAYSIGTEMKEALESGDVEKQNAVLGRLVTKFEELPENKHLIIPIAQGEGREYLPHFLVFVHSGGKTFLKHICFSSTALETIKTQVITTYDVTATLGNEKKRARFARSLMSMQPYGRRKDSKEVDLKGPMVLDLSLDSLLLEYGAIIPGVEGPVMKKPSRDPVRAILAVIKELDMTENKHLSPEHATLERLTQSKAHFYKVYVDHLVSYYEENERKLTTSERAKCLEGI